MSAKEILRALEQLTLEECQQVRQALERRLAGGTTGSSEAAFKQRLLTLGLLSEIKQPLQMARPEDRIPIRVTGKPISQMIIEERQWVGVYFFGSSALVKWYAAELGTRWVCSITDPASGNEIYIARITGVELIAAFVRKARAGEIIPTDAQRAIANFKADWSTQYQIVEITAGVVNRAMDYAERYGLRGYDAVQLSMAYGLNDVRQVMGLSSLVFVCADADLNHAAVAEGITVEDPNQYSWAIRY